MVLRLQWQMERLMSDKTKTDLALAIITRCEGVDKDRILTGYTMLRGLVDSVDMFLPLFRKVFPNAQQKLENIRMLKNRSSVYINEAVKRFQGVATDVLLDALNNKQEHFEKSWQKLVDFCVSVSEEQRYADERLTSIGKEIYRFGYDIKAGRLMPKSVSCCSVRGSLGWPDVSLTEGNLDAICRFYISFYAKTLAAFAERHPVISLPVLPAGGVGKAAPDWTATQ